MLAIERQEQIVSQIRRDGAVRIHELTKQFGVLTINVELFGRETPVEISFADVKLNN